MADYFAEQEKAKVEARRAEKIRNYQNQISSLNNQMDDLNMEASMGAIPNGTSGTTTKTSMGTEYDFKMFECGALP